MNDIYTTQADKDRWQKISAALDEALDLGDADRAKWLAELADHDSAFARDIAQFLDSRAAIDDAGFLATSPSLAAPMLAGQAIGDWLLESPVGQGGMGAVWLARRADNRFDGKAAVKLLNMSLVGQDGERRFKREGTILAKLAHPHISRLLDAGIAQTGQPYLILEYVDGQHIDAYCDAKNLDIEARVRLFLDVLAAVAHAHTNLIVHRDLKPSNVLVANDGNVKLLDFGIAKLIVDDPSACAITREGGNALTPEFAAPEQLLGQPITTVTDVYSLGVLLYLLLGGQHPNGSTNLPPAELVKAIVEAAPPLVSDVVSQIKTIPLETLSKNAAHRAATTDKLKRLLRGDLDNIIAKTLKKNPAERYASVSAFADDLRRYLDHQPIAARPDSFGYRTGKFVRRHRGGVAAGLLTMVAVSAGVVGTIWQAQRANEQAQVARAEAARADEVKKYMASIFTSAVPREGTGGVVTASDLLTEAGKRIDKELSINPGVAAEVALMIAESFDALGEPGKGEKPLILAVPYAEKAFGKQHPVTIRSKLLLAAAIKQHDLNQALVMLEEITPDVMAGLPATANEAVKALSNRSYILAKQSKAEDSYMALREAVKLGEKYLGPQHASTVEALGFLSNTYGRFDDRARQMETATEALRRATAAFANQRPHTILIAVERWYAEALRKNSRPRDALLVIQRVIDDQQNLDAAPTMRVRNAKIQLLATLNEVGRVSEALPLARELVALEKLQNPVESDDRAAYVAQLANTLTAAHLVSEASVEDARARAIYARLGHPQERREISGEIRHARILALSGSHAEAAEIAAAAVARSGTSHPDLRTSALIVQALNARMQLKHTEAVKLMREISADPQENSFRLSLQSNIASELAAALLETGDVSGAENAAKRCLNLFQRAQINPSIRVATCLVSAARVQLSAGNPLEAEQLLMPLVLQWAEVNPNSQWHGEALYWTALAQRRAGKIEQAKQTMTLARTMLKKSNLPALKKLVS